MVGGQIKSYDSFLGFISHRFFVFAAILGIIIVACNAYEVIARYAFSKPTGFMEEVLIYADIGLIWLALAWGWRTKNHVSIEVFTNRLHGRWRSGVSRGALLISFVTLIGLLWAVIGYEGFLIRTWRRPDTELSTPWWIPHMMCVLGAVLFFLVVLIDVVKEIRAFSSQKKLE